MKPLILLAVIVGLLTGCGLPKRGVVATEAQIRKCERVADIALGMYGIGPIVGLGGVIAGMAGAQVGLPIFVGGWTVGASGLGILYYLEKVTSCPMP